MENKIKKKLIEVIDLGEGVNVELDKTRLKLSKGSVSLERDFQFPIKKEENTLVVESKRTGKKEKRLVKTIAAHIRNMIKGLSNKYVYKLQVCSVHFPITLALKDKELIIKNFLGEVKERKARIIEGVSVKIDKDIITVDGHDKEKVSQTAANMEIATKIRNRDRRVYQDGIFILEKQKGARF